MSDLTSKRTLFRNCVYQRACLIRFTVLFCVPPPRCSPCQTCIFALCSQDHETAASAVRNLNNADVGGRPLRIDLADSDPFLEGKTTVRGELLDGSDPRGRWRDHREQHDRDRDRDRYDNPRDHPKPQEPNAFLSTLPPGVPISPGSTALDTISQTLATMSPAQLVEVLAQMKVCCGSWHWQVTQY